jgi:hypothetical protein
VETDEGWLSGCQGSCVIVGRWLLSFSCFSGRRNVEISSNGKRIMLMTKEMNLYIHVIMKSMTVKNIKHKTAPLQHSLTAITGSLSGNQKKKKKKRFC